MTGTGAIPPRAGPRRLTAGLALLVWLSAGAGPGAAEEPRRVLLLYSAHSTLPAYRQAQEGVEAVLGAELGGEHQIFAEYRDDQRLPGPEEDRLFAGEMRRKYAGTHFDAVLAFDRSAMAYAFDNRQVLGDAPVVFGGVTAGSVAETDLPPDTYGLVNAYSVARTLDFARRMQPRARRAVVFSGSSPFDRSWPDRVRGQLKETAGAAGIAVDFVSDLTLEGFRARAAALDPDTILILLSIFRDAAGANFTPARAAARIAEVSAAPVYSIYETFVAAGALGGEVARFQDVGAAMAGTAVRLMAGETGLPRLATVPARPMVNWPKLAQYGLSPDRLPAGTIALFRETSPWDRYRPQILLALGIILAQSATIAALVRLNRRRRAAVREATEARLELSHAARVSQLGELSGALAHELNQPLTAILANAEAGQQLLARDPPDLAELAEILGDIVADDRRAAATITELRQLLSRQEIEVTSLDLTATARAALRLAAGGLGLRGVTVDPPREEALAVRGNPAQLKQVVLNLVLNAADAVAGLPPERRRIRVETALRPDGWRELSVRDDGPGVAADLGDPFRPFATSKPTGLGLGLSLCRTIARAHGGTIAFDPTVTTGARVVLALPPPGETP